VTKGEAKPNTALTDLRMRSGYTQEALAAAVCDEVERVTGNRPALSDQSVSRLECGTVGKPRNPHVREAFRVILGVASDDALGFPTIRPPRRRRGEPPGAGAAVPEQQGVSPVDRRSFLTSATALGLDAALFLGAGPAAAAVRRAPTTHAQLTAAEPMSDAELVRALSAAPGTMPVELLRRALVTAQQYYRQARYGLLGNTLPALMEQAQTFGDPAITCQVCILASEHLIKIGDDDLARFTAERARAAAELAGDPISRSNAAWMLCVTLRHAGRHELGLGLTENAAAELAEATGLRTDLERATYGHMHLTAAYTAAGLGNAHSAMAHYAEAATMARRFDHEHPHGMWFFGPGQFEQYGVSIGNNLGDVGTAMDHAGRVHLGALASVERQERFLVDLTRTHLAAGNTGAAAEAIREVVLIAPQAARRPRVRELAHRAGIRSLTD